MPAPKKGTMGCFFRSWNWFKNGLVQVVPEDIAFCAFDCREPQCRHGEWETCEKRLLGWAAYRGSTTRGKTNA